MKKKSPVFNGELMLIPSVVERFVVENNQQLCKDILRLDFQGDRGAFQKKLCEELSEYLYGSFNVAVQLHPKKHGGFKFLGKYALNLYIPFYEDLEDKNIYTIVQQPAFKIKTPHGVFSIIPDIGVFVNGFLIYYLQLKLQHKGQNAREQGRGQIIGDYIETIKRGIVDALDENNKNREALSKESLKYFHSPMHLVAMDTSCSYIIRGIGKYYSDFEKLYLENKANDAE